MEIMLINLDMDTDSMNEKQISAYRKAVADANTAITDAEDAKAVEAAVSSLKDAVSKILDENCPSKVYTDVAKGAWYHDYVDYMVDNGYMNGVSKTEFGIDSSVTRAQLVTILYRIAGEPSVDGEENPFTDVAKDQWYTDAIIWAAGEGIVNGVSATEFAPNKEITREQIVTILYRYDGQKKVEKDQLSSFTDAGKIADYAVDAMNWAIAEEIINGVTESALAPANTATRAQICAIMMRYLEK